MLVNYNGKNLFYYKEFRFVPGSNVVPQSLWDELEDNPVIKKKIKSGLFVADQDSEEDNNLDETLINMTAAKAKELISDNWDIIQLEKWQDNETRKGVLKTLEERIDAVTDHLKDQKKD